jgi:hypothetical protein
MGYYFPDKCIIDPSRLRRSQILVENKPPSRSLRAIGAQFILIQILLQIISHLRREMHPYLIVLPEFCSSGAQ